MTDQSNTNIGDENLFYPEDIRTHEHSYLKKRGLGEQERDYLGVGLSGGGIRSATFCLGAFQALAKRKQIRFIDFLSTVSGGGYFGSFLIRLFQRDNDAESVEADLRPSVDIRKKAGQIQRWLRENGRYLAPEGSGSMLYNIAIVIRNWFSMLAVMMIFGLTVFLGFEAILNGLNQAGVGVIGRSGFHLAAGIPLIVSSLLFIPLAVLTLFYFPMAIAYWSFAPRSLWILAFLRSLPVALLAAAVSTMIWGIFSHQALVPDLLVIAVTMLGFQWAISMITLLIVRIRQLGDGQGRNWLSRAAKNALVLFIATFVLAIVHSLSLNLAQQGMAFVGWVGGLITASIVPFVLAASRLAQSLQSKPAGFRVPLPKRLIFGLIAILVLGGLLATMGAVAHYIFMGDQTIALAILLFAVIVCISVRFQENFINRCGLAPMYTARLVRAYLGASNKARYSGEAEAQSLLETQPDDDLKWDDFTQMYEIPSGPSAGEIRAPIHIINVTVNETVSGRSQVQQQDRKGLGLGVSPFGYSAGAHHHYHLPTDKSYPKSLGYNVFGDNTSPEELSLGQWVGISGAAFNTGLGYRTSLGMSVLTGLFNIRLGYWWNSGQAPHRREQSLLSFIPEKQSWYRLILKSLFPVQVHLFDEWTARFKGTIERHWHLSDGGHFENLAAYELVRRKVPVMVIIDAEADPDYAFQGLANLTRKARLDYGAEITFYDREELETRFGIVNSPVGTLEDLRRGRWSKTPSTDQQCLEEVDQNGLSRAHAALASVTYHTNEEPSVLLYIKPALTGDEPTDLIEYHRNHPSFPHETTADQFFDEAQWESYRKLGIWTMSEVLRSLAQNGQEFTADDWAALLAATRRV